MYIIVCIGQTRSIDVHIAQKLNIQMQVEDALVFHGSLVCSWFVHGSDVQNYVVHSVGHCLDLHMLIGHSSVAKSYVAFVVHRVQTYRV